MLSENSTVAEMREFAGKIGRAIPKELTRKADIFEFLKDTKKSEDPTHDAAEAHRAALADERAKQVRTQADNTKKAAKVPLNEKEKAQLAELEELARSGRQPNTDQMRELGILRRRSNITKLSVVEENELAEMEVTRQSGVAEPIPSSGVTQEERYEQLKSRNELGAE